MIFKNEGNININDIYFTDSTPQGTTFVEKSVTINDQNISAYRPDIGYGVASLPPYDSAITSFQTTSGIAFKTSVDSEFAELYRVVNYVRLI